MLRNLQRGRFAAMGQGGAAATLSYSEKMISIFGSSLLGCWPLDEAGGTTAIDYSGNGRNGTVTGATPGAIGTGNGKTSYVFDGNDHINVFSAGLAAAFHGRAFSIFFNMRMDETGWANTDQRVMFKFRADGNNECYIQQEGTVLTLTYRANATSKTYNFNWYGSLFWTNIGITVDQPNDKVIFYLDGEPLSTLTGLGDWGTSALAIALLGAAVTAASNKYIGWMQNVSLVDAVATPAQVKQVSAARPAQGASVIMAFDDVSRTIYTVGYAEMSTRGIKGTFYVISSTIGGSNITATDLQTMYAAGWDIGNHTKTGNSIVSLSEAAQEVELADCKTALDALGLTRASMHVAYPNGAFNADTLTAMAATGMLTGRDTRFGGMSYYEINAIVPSGLYKLQPMQIIVNTTTLAEMEGYVDDAVNNNHPVMILIHNIGSGKDIETANFTALLDYIVASGVQTMTITQWYANYMSKYP